MIFTRKIFTNILKGKIEKNILWSISLLSKIFLGNLNEATSLAEIILFRFAKPASIYLFKVNNRNFINERAIKSIYLPWVFFRFLKLWQWYQIAQNVLYIQSFHKPLRSVSDHVISHFFQLAFVQVNFGNNRMICWKLTVYVDQWLDGKVNC